MYALNSQCPYDLFGVRVWLIAIFQVKLNMLLCPKRKRKKEKEEEERIHIVGTRREIQLKTNLSENYLKMRSFNTIGI